MKILYVGDKYDYGNIKRGYGYEHFNFYDALAKMNNRSNEVVYFPIDEMILKRGITGMNGELLLAADREKPSLIAFFGGLKTIDEKTVREITRKSGALTFYWVSDDHWMFHKYSKHQARFFTHMVTTDKKAVLKYHKLGYRNVILSQWACNHFLYGPSDLPKTYDVTFIGAAHGNRKKIVEKIKKEGIDVKCWGSGWKEGRISQKEMIKIVSQSKINLNFTKSSGVVWKELASIFFRRNFDRTLGLDRPRHWFDNIRAFRASLWSKQIKGRIFEIAGCRGFLLTEYAPHLENYYRPGREIECFNNIPELIDKIKYYLKNDEARKTIAGAGYERTLRDHTYEKRFNEIFKNTGFAPEKL